MKNGGDLGEFFSGLHFPPDEVQKLLEKFRGKFGAKSEAQFGTRIRKLRGTFVLQLF